MKAKQMKVKMSEDLQKEHKIGAVLASTGVTMGIENAHILTENHDEE